MPPIWFNVSIDYLRACQVLLVYPVVKFDKTETEASLHITEKLVTPEVQLKKS